MTYRGKEYFDALPKARKAKLTSIFERVADFPQYRNQEKFRHEREGIFSFKSFQDRLLCFFDGSLICISHGLKKKQDKLPPGEIVKAQTIRAHYFSEKG